MRPRLRLGLRTSERAHPCRRVIKEEAPSFRRGHPRRALTNSRRSQNPRCPGGTPRPQITARPGVLVARGTLRGMLSQDRSLQVWLKPLVGAFAPGQAILAVVRAASPWVHWLLMREIVLLGVCLTQKVNAVRLHILQTRQDMRRSLTASSDSRRGEVLPGPWTLYREASSFLLPGSPPTFVRMRRQGRLCLRG